MQWGTEAQITHSSGYSPNLVFERWPEGTGLVAMHLWCRDPLTTTQLSSNVAAQNLRAGRAVTLWRSYTREKASAHATCITLGNQTRPWDILHRHQQSCPRPGQQPLPWAQQSWCCRTPRDGHWNSSFRSLLDSSCCSSHEDWYLCLRHVIPTGAKLPASHIQILSAAQMPWPKALHKSEDQPTYLTSENSQPCTCYLLCPRTLES